MRNVTIRHTQLNIGVIVYCLGDPVNKNTFTIEIWGKHVFPYEKEHIVFYWIWE